ncbi:Protein of unknown function [Gryllus bimaculatus]|nr:Protein of unknown function [Gryllus bimaculatus]
MTEDANKRVIRSIQMCCISRRRRLQRWREGPALRSSSSVPGTARAKQSHDYLNVRKTTAPQPELVAVVKRVTRLWGGIRRSDKMSARRLSDAESCTSFGDPRQGCFARYINMATARKCLHTSGVLLLLLLIVFLWRSATASPTCNSYGYYCYNATHYVNCKAPTGVGGSSRPGNGIPQVCPRAGLCADNIPERCQSADTNCGTNDHVCLNATHFQFCVETSVGTMLRMGNVESCGPYMQCRENVPVICVETPPLAETLLTNGRKKPCNEFGYKCLNSTHYKTCENDVPTGIIERCPTNKLCSSNHPAVCAEPVTKPCGSMGHVCLNDTHFQSCVVDSNGALHTTGQIDICHGGTVCNESSPSICDYPILDKDTLSKDTPEDFQSNSNSENESTTEYNTLMEMHLTTEPYILNSSTIDSNVSKSMDEITESVINNGETTTGNAVEISSQINISSERK